MLLAYSVVTDLAVRKIYDHATIPAMLYFAALHTLHPAGAGMLPALGGAAGLLAAGLLVAFISRGLFGGGDIKLLAAVGAALGLAGGLAAMAAGFLAAGLLAWPLLLLRRLMPRRVSASELPMAPFFAAGTAAVLLLARTG
ncbi:prepilin peptidase [Paenibacillus albicereus]|uniref:prepilin peptidase n=1 Tax=Paenibacillus albicereus TaxID=2726185 RepID=UPI001F1D65FC|nr:prepilin peptidase [Paenibacillus albicereus]